MINSNTRTRALIMAGRLDALAKDYDYFEYMNAATDLYGAEDPDAAALETARDILEDPGIISGIMDYLQGIIDDGSAEDLADRARDLMRDMFALYLDLAPAC